MGATVGGYAQFAGMVRTALLWLGVLAAAVCAIDWAVRTRRLSPFGGTARLFRANVDPLMRPVERLVVRAGGMPSSAPWWMLGGVVVGGLLLLQVLDIVGGLLMEAGEAAAHPSALPLILASWAISLLTLALVVRVVSSWFSMSAYSRWIRWSYALTEWMLAPLRRLIPPMGNLDVSPLAAYFLLYIVRVALVRL